MILKVLRVSCSNVRWEAEPFGPRESVSFVEPFVTIFEGLLKEGVGVIVGRESGIMWP
jgi:hypothetical protein